MKKFFSKTVANIGIKPWSSVIGYRLSVIGYRSLIGDRTTMNVVSKNPFQFQRIAFAILFILSNLLFFQPTQAQVLDPFDGFTCDSIVDCPWVNDSLEFTAPGPNPNCKYTYYFKKRICSQPLNYLQLQPTAVRIKENSACDTSLMFYGDTLHNQRMEQLMKTAEKALVAYFFNDYYHSLQGLWQSGFWAKVIDGTYVEPAYVLAHPLAIGFVRPACRGICISYERNNATSPVKSVYGKWYNCSTTCCNIVHEFLYNPFPNGSDTTIPAGHYTDTNYVRVAWEAVTINQCSSNPTPNTSCEPATSETKIIRFKNCRSYCIDSSYDDINLGLYGPSYYDTYGLPNFDKSKTGVFNLDELPFISEKDFASIPDNILLESKSDEIVVGNTSEIVSIKILNLSGNEVQRIKVQPNKYYIPIYTSSLQNGMYLIVIESKNGIKTKPLIIAR
ncbi:MAG: T9SS type A sorting domain-containing protein [Candidatus Kapabacteria bacterium]|nr:T9SS type A sorting domain-containing protein [Candidatus Kapabacteria bacterium]